MGTEDEALSSRAQESRLPPPHTTQDTTDARSSLSTDVESAADLDTMKEVGAEVPSHPIPSMQGAFAESMLESQEHPPVRHYGKDAAARRQILLAQAVTEETHAARWR